jgi:hypothetical protein
MTEVVSACYFSLVFLADSPVNILANFLEYLLPYWPPSYLLLSRIAILPAQYLDH